ncbi:MAG: homocysteine S-methyltransferase family protein [Nostocoides sp.]
MTARLPQLDGHPMVTDGGLETDLLFHHGADLPDFAAYPLLASEPGRVLLRDYYLPYAAIARDHSAGLLLETPTWRANPDWGAVLGHTAADLAAVNRAAVAWLQALRSTELSDLAATAPVLVSGMIGPRGDGYRAGGAVDPAEAADYHRAQIDVFAEAGADLVTALTLTGAGEAAGVVRAARAAGIPVAVSFTVETDGRLPDGSALGAALAEVDRTDPPDYYLLNCAHPTHLALAVADLTGAQRARIVGARANASRQSHAELDEADVLDEGDLTDFATTSAALAAMLPNLRVRGGCCGTDARHVAAIWAHDRREEAAVPTPG